MNENTIESKKKRQAGYSNKHYHANADEIIRKKKERRAIAIEWFNEFKSKQVCSICGFSDSRAIEYHHRIPLNDVKATYRVNDLVAKRGWNKDHVLDYINKNIDIVCANCHKIIHAELDINLDKNE